MNDKRFKHITFNYGENGLGEEVHDYFKLKFEGRELTDYEFLLWVKLFYYMKRKEESSAEEPDPELLEAIRKEYQLPEPTVNSTSKELFDKMRAHEWIKLQDATGKYLFGPFSETYLQLPSFSINRFQRSLNITIEHLRKQIHNGDMNEELIKKSKWMFDCIRGLNYFVSLFFVSVFKQSTKEELSGDLLKRSLPYSSYKIVSVDIIDIIFRLCDAYKNDDIENKGYEKEMVFPVLLPKFIELKGIAGFSCLSSFLLDAMYFSFDYTEALMNILFFVHMNFHNSLLWGIEFSSSPTNMSIPVEERGQRDHTTQLKIYLFDSKDRPRVIRVDMPHKGESGEQYLHFNVTPIYDMEKYDHEVITKDIDQVHAVLESLKEAMLRECPNLFVVRDSTSDDDEVMLAQMHQFLAYEDLTTEYIVKKEPERALKDYCAITSSDYLTINDALEHAYLSFYDRF